MKKLMNNQNFTFNKGCGFISNKKLYMVKCFDCGVENYSIMVASGICAFCGYNPKTTEIQNKTTDISWQELKENIDGN